MSRGDNARVTDPFAPPSTQHPADAPNPWAPGNDRWSPGPWQQQQGYGGWEPPRRTNRLAVAALVTGVLALVPVAVALAWAALRQIGRRDEDGRGLAMGAICASAVWTLVAALGAVALIKSFGPEGHLRDVPSQQVGACLNKHPRQVVDCAEPHDLEVFYTGLLPDEPWPGQDTVNDDADDRCYTEYEDYVGISYEDSDYDYSFYLPDEQEWAAGKRTVVCVVTPFPGEDLTGSVKGSGH